eukprot:7585680-Alexandrium_andersonii.AAC.1
MPPRQRWAQGEWTPPAFHTTGGDQTGTANGLTWHARLRFTSTDGQATGHYVASIEASSSEHEAE